MISGPTQGVPGTWVRVCELADLERDRGVSALVRGKQLALFRTGAARVHAVANRDPATGAPSMSRGIVGRRGAHPYLAAPRGRQRFDLVTGSGLDGATARLAVFPVRILDGWVEVLVVARRPGG